jgi:cytochrome c-type biogenesis protein CcmH/NrfG
MTLQVIEPPVDPATGSASFRGEAATVVGRIDAPAGVLTLRVNGHEVAPDARGLFRATLPGATRDVEIVAVDRNGVRRAVAFMLVPAPPPTAAAASPAPAADDSARSRCYALAIAPPAPDPSALEVCRAAVQQSPDSAIDHYNLGVALSRLGRHAEAIMSYREAAGRWAR